MKIIYCIHGTYNSGGMERILAQKVNNFAQSGMEVIIVTSDQKGRPSYFDLDPRIRVIDLGVNYCDLTNNSLITRQFSIPSLRRKHRRLLTELLLQERADIVVSMYSGEMKFLPFIEDGSKKVLEIHFANTYLLDMMRIAHDNNPIFNLVARYRRWRSFSAIRRYDKFVVLTREDLAVWARYDMRNIEYIPNFIDDIPAESCDYATKRVISVGRHNAQKGFDFLIRSWAIVSGRFPDWRLAVVGGGDSGDHQRLAEELGVGGTIDFVAPTKHIEQEYLKSSIYVMSSRFEGLPMVLVEAAAYGLPMVSYACQCGPRDIIENGVNGLLVDKVGDVNGLAEALMVVMGDQDMRSEMGGCAKRGAQQYTMSEVLPKWDKLFDGLLN